VLSIITFICSIVYSWDGHGWVEFVACSAFVTALIYFILTLLNLINFVNRFPGPWLLIVSILCILLWSLVVFCWSYNHLWYFLRELTELPTQALPMY